MSDRLHVSREWLSAHPHAMSIADYAAQYEVMRPFVAHELRDARGVAGSVGPVTKMFDYPVIYTVVKTGEQEFSVLVLGTTQSNIGPHGHFTLLESYSDEVTAFAAMCAQMATDQNFDEV